MNFKHQEVEAKWRKYWVDNQTYKVSNNTDKPKFYVLDMFPYPSGAGLHVGHPLGYIASDIYARFKKMKGFNVLHPMGYDSFGLPAEQYAIQTGVHPAVSTAENVEVYRSQLDNLGFNFDWSREIQTSDPKYYKWTQWIFIQLYNHCYSVNDQKAISIDSLSDYFDTNGSKNCPAYGELESEFTAEEWKAKSELEKADILMNFRLAYRKVGYVNWCEELGTVLANDEVKDGLSERGGYPVEKKAMKQWSLRITAYAERMLNSLDKLEWSDALKTMQRNWIGRSEGAQLFFQMVDHPEKIEVFTTRPDTVFGATFMVLAPEHDWVKQITTETQTKEVEDYLKYVGARSEVERMAETKTVTGAFTGAYAINPFTNKQIPIWISEYVLKDYGTGAIMAVPSDDDRDNRFAKKFGIEIIDVVDKSDYPGATLSDKLGKIINSDFLNGMEVKDAITAAIQKAEELNIGTGRINYRLRDANYSRQRYWGEPFPISYDTEGKVVTTDIEKLPVTLPELDDFKPASGGKSPLARAEDWVSEGGLTKETDTMPGFAGSSWYFLRYMDAHNDEAFAGKEAIDYWQDVDLYVGGTEHAVGHLMYSRFWHKFLYDLGYVPTKEPFKKLINQGMIQGVIEYIYLQKEKVDGNAKFLCSGLVTHDGNEENYTKIPIHIDYVTNYGAKDSYINLDGIKKFIDWRPEFANAIFECSKGIYQSGKFTPKDGSTDSRLVTVSETGKMSKRYFNVVNPDDIVHKYGADCFRMYEMFLGPIEQSKPWDTQGIEGISKFIRKLWSLFYTDDAQYIVTDDPANKEAHKALNKLVQKVEKDILDFSMNTAISAFMVAVNELKKLKCHSKEILQPLVKTLAPFAPFITEELWEALGNNTSVHLTDYPAVEEKYLKEDSFTYPVCINGKKRASLTIGSDADKDTIEKAAMELDEMQKWFEEKQPIKTIIVPQKMINFVVK